MGFGMDRAVKHRATLLVNGKKSASLATGDIGWKANRGSIERTKDEKLVIAEIEKRGQKKLFTRVKTSIDKTALLKHQDDARR
jgi:phage host-nuclease inhibitor protein Gam